MTQSCSASHLRLVPDQPQALPNRSTDLADQQVNDFTDEELYKARSFTMIGNEKAILLIELVKSKQIMWRDLGVLIAMTALTDWRSGTCKATASGLAKELGWKPNVVSLSLSRLKKIKLIAPAKDAKTRASIYLIDPRLVIYGTGKRRGYLIKRYAELVFGDTGKDVVV